ncbi:ParB/RepB/Spo0J family partition protein [Culicoidibacter larvae]|uniref:ParB-like N-terminal domain-containing protein n=1 Tax=Culicoidibacter larvae TaxID=2579976 RepID=A0A5R8QH50_9FIRM|nr:ParB/RepB/Spo0J family partition protein [Culicoidibacter larvae]TLG77355.1 hypothetical protein FEZ08_01680 [Culicoidibacter larvae]
MSNKDHDIYEQLREVNRPSSGQSARVAELMLGNPEEMQLTTIKLSVLNPSKYNRMPIVKVEELMEQIKADGLQNPIHVRFISDDNIINIAGHRRAEAYRRLGYDEIPAFIRRDIKTDLDEQRAVAINNVQREETKEIVKQKVLEWGDIYEIEKSRGNIPAGIRKRVWIAQFTNLSERSVQRYLTEYEAIEGDVIEKPEIDPLMAAEQKVIKQAQSFSKHLAKYAKLTDKRQSAAVIQELEKLINIVKDNMK